MLVVNQEKVVNVNMEKVTHKGTLRIGDMDIPCYVTEDGRRVISGRRTQVALGVADDDTNYQISGKRMVRFLEQKSLKPLFNNISDRSILESIKIIDGKRVIVGYDARLLPHICDVMLKGRRDGVVTGPRQIIITKKCEILLSGFAQVGIIALVDEATGYQEIRDRLALQKILDQYITDEWAKWTKTFPDEFYKELFRLKNIPYPPNPKSLKKPSYVGHWTNDVIYSRLAPGVLNELRKKNPRQPSGSRKRKFHQYLTRDIGHPTLKEHLSNVIFLMKSCTNWNDFKRRLSRAKPKYGDTFEIPFEYGDEK